MTLDTLTHIRRAGRIPYGYIYLSLCKQGSVTIDKTDPFDGGVVIELASQRLDKLDYRVLYGLPVIIACWNRVSDAIDLVGRVNKVRPCFLTFWNCQEDYVVHVSTWGEIKLWKPRRGVL